MGSLKNGKATGKDEITEDIIDGGEGVMELSWMGSVGCTYGL